jgi:hypothetical protein
MVRKGIDDGQEGHLGLCLLFFRYWDPTMLVMVLLEEVLTFNVPTLLL